MVILLVSAILIQLIFWFSFSTIVIRNRKTDSVKSNFPVSIIVCVKNEENTIKDCIDFLLNQDYPEFEIIIVDDFSTDQSPKILKQIKDEKITIIHPVKNLPGKKEALKTGINASNFPNILLTDADCRGISRNWISLMASGLNENSLILGYAPLNFKGLVGRFGAYETWLTAVQYLTYSLAGNAYMGVGRNLCYKKELFKEINLANYKNISSGDDDLFVNALKEHNIGIQVNHDAFIYSDAHENLISFLKQKTRHVSTASFYSWRDKILLSIFAASQMLIYPLIILCMTFTSMAYKILLFYIFYILIKWIFSIHLLAWLKEKRLILWIPFFDFLVSIYYWVLSPWTLILKKKEWN